VIADELVDEDDLAVDVGGKTVGLGQEVVFGVVLDVSDDGRLFLRSAFFDFLFGSTQECQGYAQNKM
jgi:hypothetical protein